MKNNKVFIVCRTDYKSWQLSCRNAEKHVTTRNFFFDNVVCDGSEAVSEHFEAVSARSVLDGTEGYFKKWLKLRKAVRSCSYVYPVAGCEDSRQCRSLMRFARLTGRHIINEEEPL